MVAKIKKEIEVDIKTLSVSADVRYWEDATINGVKDEEGELVPCRKGDMWCPEIDIETGIVNNWTKGVKAEIHYKVCDCGTYILKDAEGNEVVKKEGYVPDILTPKGNGYGDYIIMDIDEDGKIIDYVCDIDDLIHNHNDL